MAGKIENPFTVGMILFTCDGKMWIEGPSNWVDRIAGFIDVGDRGQWESKS